ncbi:MAG TPA: glycosyltransferase [Elusimicrobiales bacterium]|nr:glycosyltransferase [Elusimicrobiales bacterium]
MSGHRELIIICPVYNESAASLVALAGEWETVLENETRDWEWFFIDDGSSLEETTAALRRIAACKPRFKLLRTANQGHGQACIYGYRTLSARARWLLQIDSDGQCRPQDFRRLWEDKLEGSHQFGIRRRRQDGRLRALLSLCIRFYLRLATGVSHPDPNCPFRLLYAPLLPPYLNGLQFNLANLALALRLRANTKFTDIGFARRRDGRSTHRVLKSIASILELRRLSFSGAPRPPG